MLNRRDFLAYLASCGVCLSFPSILSANKLNNKTLVLVELKGGNDGLNTLIPYADSLYKEIRPTLAIEQNKIIKIDNKVGFHPSLKGMMELFDRGELACLQGVGYENPNRSHFRSIEIWESASSSQEYLNNGWITDIFLQKNRGNTLDGLVVGKDSLGPMFGEGMKTLVFDDPKKFAKATKYLGDISGDISTNNRALRHLLNVQEDIDSAKEMFAKRLIPTKKIKSHKQTKQAFSKALFQTARIIASDMNIPVIKVSLGSFDTHGNQLSAHSNLLKQLGDNLLEFRNILKEHGKWNDVLVMTYSEFGRRVSENASKGTDHGQASVHFALGGKVRGGLYGKYPSLSNLDSGDLKHNIDFKSIYSSIAEDWWSVKKPSRLEGFAKIKFL